ncbi:hypothetical protein FGG08_002533 [Glutinoglossum americanum]|uniref:WD40 repeat-like protein n=1 Tax=Glutinoglossum americanum TaxID=1670608 RepID=A0A9P8HZZ0_9PEZI|nr:hypothetical protein FGG08_002533 [Glutinoglossum americanum]
MRPSISSAAVTVASFHPGRPNVFLLAFADGALAAYDATRLFRDGGKGERRAGTAAGSVDGEIAHVSSIHTIGTAATSDPGDGVNARIGEETQSSRAGDVSVGLTAAEFIPGFRARVVSVGTDGKCILVDFEGEGKKAGVVLKTWHVRAPATSLSLLQVNDAHLAGRTGGGIDGAMQKRREILVATGKSGDKGPGNPYLIAIGRVDGKVVVFNSSGGLLGEKTVDPDGRHVIGVEWAIEAADEGNRSKDKGVVVPAKYRTKKQPPSIPTRRPESRVPLGRKKRKSMSSILAAGRDVEEEIFPDVDDAREPEKVQPYNIAETTSVEDGPPVVKRESVWQDVIEPSVPDYMNLFSPIKRKVRRRISQASTLPLVKERKSTAARIEEFVAKEECDAGSAISTPLLSTEDRAPKETSCLSVSQRPTPKTRHMPTRQGILHTIHQSSKPPSLTVGEEDRKLLAEIRHARENGADGRGNSFTLFAPYMKKRVAKQPANSPTLQASTEISLVSEGSLDPVGDIWLANTSSRKKKGPRDGRKPPQISSESSSSTVTRNRKTVSFQHSTDIECSSQASPAKLSPHRKLPVHGGVPEPVKHQPVPSSHPGEFHPTTTNNPREGTHDAPLAEMSRNSYSPTKRLRSCTPKRRPSRASTPVRFPKNHPQPQCCPSHSHLHDEVAKLHEEMRLFQVKMIREFQGQKQWFEEIVVGERKASEAVREENERLRRELFEVVRAEVGLGKNVARVSD